LEDGVFENENAGSPLHLDKNTSQVLAEVLREGVNQTTVNSKNRFALLDGLVTYYETQLGLKPHAFHSHEILKTVFS
jgi:hypothetical protein